MPASTPKGNTPERTPTASEKEALDFHAQGRPGKLEINPTKPMTTQRDLSLAYSPGVAVPVKAIAEDPALAYDYTAKGNLVAVISNGTAILGLGNLGALASKPVMEGKAVLFKRFADVDSIDLEVDTTNIDEFINAVRYLGPSFGGINLEDIKAPDCFIIEQRLREVMDIPVFHDDQHGTAIIAAAGMINALHLTGRDIKNTKLVCNGAGSAGIACIELIKAIGFPAENVTLCDTKGVVYQGREEGMNQWKSAHAIKTSKRTLEDAMKDADIFFGVSAKGALTKEMVRSMAPNPIIFAMANPDPEVTPEDVAEVRDDAIVATGRSDYPNQVNNVLGFPYIFRGALDVRATTINDEMKIAAVYAIAELAREDVPDDVVAAYQGSRPRFGPQYIIPVPFDPRLLATVSAAVAKAAMETGVAGRAIDDLEGYKRELLARRDPIASTLRGIYERVRRQPKRIVFAEGEEEQVMRAAVSYVNQGLGTAILVGREERVAETAKAAGLDLDRPGIEVINARLSSRNTVYADYLYEKLQRKGYLTRDCHRLINNDRNHFAACMVALGDADGMVTGITRNYATGLEDVRRVIDSKPGHRLVGVSIALCRGRTVFIADTAVHEQPTAEELADIAVEAAGMARRMGYVPRVALTAFSTFGHMVGESSARIQEAVRILNTRHVDFEFDGEMSADVALNPKLMDRYPFIRLSGPANVIVTPDNHSASIAANMLQELGGATIIGPLLVGLDKPAQIVNIGAKDTDIVNMAAIAAYNATS
ncbi:NADP-dependent malic enzyme [Brucella pituitosa]|uniref:NADP-dependent malic enzyme n=1 Tax=Brucella pituitosa TaxID=571256 RepID=A0A643F322_9HYPH|nr:NADP-dependent malic enzyme [Brucella pituitosa]PQZ49181.1 NADP-dependent malic enzyme [Ochrobactrum sp. MYb19]PRA57614.1 NADP-dependent malic enzyme [Ochrobactrum sp. MYb68]PRA67001.1 NADP-dependent malic enzyme [Ochrobactrum sp. MYb18]PRA75968.1 NADP-dependent malic enzyme [Brucella thiophenivorans]PRA88967.1 NADP-dependent malic enzyme [Ochrobactrum sp. MYb29]PRA92011.1 NADP-dependent malic enzyme [Ochrobactrum sp. MYb14]PRA97976.1 NADP-dependent malic enzyme [Ochrobactrum sp. MYb15]T